MIKEIRDDHLYWDGCDTVELAQKYGTPLYVLSETAIADRCAQLRAGFADKYENTRVAYAGKAFCTLAMLKIIQREGLCLDVVSGGELYTAIKAEFPPERIEFNGNNTRREEIELAVDYGIGRIIIDNLHELALIEAVCAARGKQMKVLYRITPGVQSDTHAYMTTGKRDSKFGIPLDDGIIFPAIKAAIDSEWVDFCGFHFHVGSQILDNAYHLAAARVSLELMWQTEQRFGCPVRELNFGGGFAIRYVEGDSQHPFGYYLDPLMALVEGFCAEKGLVRPAIVVEPGRAIVGEAGITLYTIGGVKDIPGVRKYLSVDGGMTDNIRVGLYQACYEGVVANRAGQPADEVVSIAGKCCESTDILIADTRTAKAQVGDIYATFATGAYGYAMANNYNKTPLPAVVLVKNGRDDLIVRRQTNDQLLENELIPDTLR